MLKLSEMRAMMSDIVQKCVEKHGGGEAYFDELDGMIRENEDLLVSYVAYVASCNPNSSIVMSGEIGKKCLKLQQNSKIPMGLRIYVVNGGLRKGAAITEIAPKYKRAINPEETFVFIDDSFYSGKTLNAVKKYIEERLLCSVCGVYTFYDGCKDKHGVKSLYRYYGKEEVDGTGITCEECYINHKKIHLEWNVFAYNWNVSEIAEANIFKHYRFREDVVMLITLDLDREEFDERLKSTLMYYFWAKAEYEILISSLFGDGKERIKVDIYRQVAMNFDKFSEYLWGFKEGSR